jgi:hypothetical protein
LAMLDVSMMPMAVACFFMVVLLVGFVSTR